MYLNAVFIMNSNSFNQLLNLMANLQGIYSNFKFTFLNSSYLEHLFKLIPFYTNNYNFYKFS